MPPSRRASGGTGGASGSSLTAEENPDRMENDPLMLAKALKETPIRSGCPTTIPDRAATH